MGIANTSYNNITFTKYADNINFLSHFFNIAYIFLKKSIKSGLATLFLSSPIIIIMKNNLRFVSLTLLLLAAKASSGQQTPAPFLTAGGRYQYVDRQSMQPVFNSSFEVAHPFSNGLALTEVQGKHQYILPSGQTGIDIIFDDGSPFRDKKAVIFKNKFSYLIDEHGKNLALEYPVQEWTIADGRAVVTNTAGKAGYIDTENGRNVVPCIYEYARPYSEALAAVRQNGKWGFIDKGGKIIVPADYDDVTPFGEGLAGIKQGNKWGVIDATGKVVIALRYDKITPFAAGHAFAKLTDGSWGIIDHKGVPASQPLRYQVITPLSDGLAAFMHNNAWGFIDVTGRVIIPASYLRVSSFDDGLAMVIKDNQRFYIDKEGREFRRQ